MSILCVLTPEIKPVKPGFAPAHKPGFTGLKTGGFTRVFGYPGTRVAFPSSACQRGIAPLPYATNSCSLTFLRQRVASLLQVQVCCKTRNMSYKCVTQKALKMRDMKMTDRFAFVYLCFIFVLPLF